MDSNATIAEAQYSLLFITGIDLRDPDSKKRLDCLIGRSRKRPFPNYHILIRFTDEDIEKFGRCGYVTSLIERIEDL